jgi:DHA1 family tetracycline resistance protein-like MFS transporter
VTCTAALSDLFTGKDLGAAFATLWACAGLGVVFGPLTEGTLLARPGASLGTPYLALACLGAAHSAFVQLATAETLPPSKRKPFSMDGVNPFSFLKLLSERTSPTLKKLVGVASLQSFLEGKNLVDFVQVGGRCAVWACVGRM